MPNDPAPDNEYERAYSEPGFWQKVGESAQAAGRDVIEKALLLYYAARSPQTPAWAKATIYGALGYFISLIDAVPDLTPVLGYTDDLGVLALAIATIASYIDDDVRAKARRKLAEWFESPPDRE